MANPRYRSYLGIAKETTKGTAVAATAFIPVRNITPFDNITYLDDKNWRGSMVDTYDTRQGVIYSEFDFEGDVFPDTVPYVVGGIMGEVATTGASAPYTHTFTILNSGTGQPTSYTLTDFYGRTDANPVRRYAATQFSEIDFKFSADGLLEYSAKGVGYGSAVSTAPTTSFSTVTVVPAWTGTTTIAGSVSTLLESGNIKISRSVNPIHTVDNSQTPYQVFVGAMDVTGSLTLVMEDDTQLNYYLNNTQPSLVINFAQGTGGTATGIQFTMTKCAFMNTKIDRSQDYVQLTTDFHALANTTDKGASGGYGPIQVACKNATATGTTFV